MGLIYFIVGVLVGFTIHSVLSIASINDAYEEGYEDGKKA